MKRKTIYLLLFSSFSVLIALIVIFGKKQEVAPLKQRSQFISASSEWVNTKAAIEGLQEKIRNNPGNLKAKLNLAQAYLQEARVTGDYAYYDGAAMQLLKEVLRKEPDNFDALCTQSSVYLSQHHFAEALEIAHRARKISDFNAFLYGLLTDGNVELGDYPKAIEMADKMVSIRPDLRSYSRISYLREIHGDYPGAIEAMKMAVQSGYPGLEQTAWVRVKLGELYEHTGDPEKAKAEYWKALAERPNYAYAMAGLGRVEKAKQNYKQAIDYLESAGKLVKDYSFADEITDIYLLNHQPEKARESAESVIATLSGKDHLGNEEDGTGHYADRELAYAYLKAQQLDLALKHAKIEYDRRPNNIDVNETLAWVHYKRGEYADGAKYIAAAMRTNSQNPTLLYRAGLIQLKNGQVESGLTLMKKATTINPYLSPTLIQEGNASASVAVTTSKQTVLQ